MARDVRLKASSPMPSNIGPNAKKGKRLGGKKKKIKDHIGRIKLRIFIFEGGGLLGKGIGRKQEKGCLQAEES